jgi:methionyl-tRNA formyltransferase
MKIIFFGTPQFAAGILEGVFNSPHKILLVITGPDKPVGRGRKNFRATQVKTKALELGIPLLETLDANEPDIIKKLKDTGADLGLVVAYGQKLSPALLNSFKYGCVNVHASVLPDYRGAAPIQWVLINGEKETGITLFKMNKRIDRGEILSIQKCTVSDKDNFATLHDKLLKIGIATTVKTLEEYEKGFLTPMPQPKGGKYYGKLTKKDGLLNPKDSSENIINKIRGLNPCPGTRLNFRGKKINILSAEMAGPDNLPASFDTALPGEIIDISPNSGLMMKTGTGAVFLKKLKMQSRNMQTGSEFVRGYQVKKGEIFKNENCEKEIPEK